MSRQEQHTVLITDINVRPGMVALVLAFVIGTTYLMVPAAHAQTFQALHSFSGRPDGANPFAGVVIDAAGNLDGTTFYGGENGWGMVFKLARRGSGWVLSPLYSFQSPYTGGHDGNSPYATVTIGRDGNLYGTTGGGGEYGAGTVFKLSPPATVCKAAICPWTETQLYQFSGGSDGAGPEGAVIFDGAGNLYGTTYAGGATNQGVAFELTPSGSGWTETVLHAFTGSPDGADPASGMIFDQAGNLYGTTQFGGCSLGCGTVFELTPSASGWTETVLYNFQGANDGAILYGGLVLDPAGNLYGTTVYGGAGGGGTVFELTPSKGDWDFSVLHSFVLQPTGGPTGTLARSAAGNLYGTVFSGGNGCSGYGCGSVFELSPSAGGWTFTSLYEFNDGRDGGNPYAGVTLDSAGNLYGTTSGLLGGDGSVFQIMQ